MPSNFEKLIEIYAILSISTCIFDIVVLATKQEGEGCGPCFSPESNYFCGNCSAGLHCVKDERLPDAPGKCTKKSGMN